MDPSHLRDTERPAQRRAPARSTLLRELTGPRLLVRSGLGSCACPGMWRAQEAPPGGRDRPSHRVHETQGVPALFTRLGQRDPSHGSVLSTRDVLSTQDVLGDHLF